MATVTPSAKQRARQLLDGLPDDSTWDDIVYELAVRRSIELGLADADAGRVMEVNEVRRQFRLSE
jgi:predicted transcriptional regulator